MNSCAIRSILFFTLAIGSSAHAQRFHANIEPLYFFVEASNLALDVQVIDSLSLGFQYAQLEGGRQGKNLSGFQAFYSIDQSNIHADTSLVKLYLGRLSPQTKLLGIQTAQSGEGLYELLAGYRWVWPNALTVSILGGVFFTSQKIYPSVSIPVGWLFN